MKISSIFLASSLLLSAESALSKPNFRQVDSSCLEIFSESAPLNTREDFYALEDKTEPPLIGKSPFVSLNMVEHLMRNKKDSALGTKYVPGDFITNMEGAMHTFVTPICSMVMTGDYHWIGHLEGHPFGHHQVRSVILSAAIHPDFEFDNVVWPLVRVGQTSVEGAFFAKVTIPSREEKTDKAFLDEYESRLLRHMIYHLAPDRRLPALNEIHPAAILDMEKAKGYLEAMMDCPLPRRPLYGMYVRTPKDDVISMEILFQIYIQQIANEFKVLDPNTPQGYIYTIDPPLIFSQYLGDSALQNRVQALALKWVYDKSPFVNMVALAFNDWADSTMVPLLQKALPFVRVMKKGDLYNAQGEYIGPAGRALVIHNNSDAFGQNIETEGPTSADGVIGTFSDAALHLDRQRRDLVSFVY